MSFPKNNASGNADALKVDDRNDALDTLIRQTSGKDAFLNFTMANESPAQLIQIMNVLEHEGLGWPLCSPLKIQMQKCDKCSCEFCSTINYRRHTRLHRQNLNLDKDSTEKTRGLLQAFWDKRRPEEAIEIMSFNDVALEGVSGYSILKALASFAQKPWFSSLPPSYVTSGSALLDIVQGNPSRFPLSSRELFSILDDASEKTFLCAGTAESLMKYVFDGEAGKIGLEMKNLVACTSFLVEQKLVKACFADKDAEALRYQKLLVDEEEAAQKRQAALLEKKRLKKLRQKEHRAKEQASAERDDSPEDRSLSSPTSSSFDAPDSILDVLEVPHNGTLSSELVPHTSSSFDTPNSILEEPEVPHNGTLSSEPVRPTSSSFDTPDSILEVPEVPHNGTLSSETVPLTPSSFDTPDSILEVPEVPHNGTLSSEPVQIISMEEDIDKSCEIGENEYSNYDTYVYPFPGNYQNVEHRPSQSARRRTVNSRWQAPKLQKTPNVFHTSNNHQASYLGTTQKRASSRDSRIAVSNGAKVWTPKPKLDTDKESCKTRLQIDAPNHAVSNGVKVLTPKLKSDTDEESCKTRLQIEAPNLAVSNGVEVWTPKPRSDTDDEEICKTRSQIEAPNLDEQVKKREVLIGSIPVTLRNRNDMQQGEHLVRAPESSSTEFSSRDVNGSHARPVKIEVIQGTANSSTVKLWRPNQNGNGACEENCAYTESGSRFSSHAAKAFLANRWKEAITSNHVKLVLSTEELDKNQGTAPMSEVDHRGILRSAEGYTNLEHVAAVKSKVRGKAVKGSKEKHIPKRSGYN